MNFRVRYAPAVSNYEQNLRQDLGNVRKIVKYFSDLSGLSDLTGITTLSDSSKNPNEIDNNNNGNDAFNTNGFSLKEVSQHLDLALLYLRRVFFFCYYCATNCKADCEENLLRTCGDHHWRHYSANLTEAVAAAAAAETNTDVAMDASADSQFKPKMSATSAAWMKQLDTNVDVLLNGPPIAFFRAANYYSIEK